MRNHKYAQNKDAIKRVKPIYLLEKATGTILQTTIC